MNPYIYHDKTGNARYNPKNPRKKLFLQIKKLCILPYFQHNTLKKSHSNSSKTIDISIRPVFSPFYRQCYSFS